MEELSYKVRISALWLLQMVAFFAYRTIAVSEGVTEVSVLSNSELAEVLLIMMAFAFLTLILWYPRLNRLMNIIAGAVFAVVHIAMFADGITAYPSQSFNLMTGASIVLVASVIWLAVKWPRRQAITEDRSVERSKSIAE